MKIYFKILRVYILSIFFLNALMEILKFSW